ncbi:MAG: VOC family protein [Flavobacteriales bacterium]|nr:VOC family protein [Flavobacteriales bacterium]MBK6943733.1 VOC family protein [Flavobacteriales bacterium]MBK7239945.1 VOC family protein [Flavobacteriales bacterium]MBK7296992.1 VOC family protein [Flavobacteriales bacterium]MBK9535735.1 VOC family protein [Flavobacteriales bacterium]
MTGHIHTPTPDLAKSIDFYKRLGFTVASEGTPTLITDGDITIEINAERTARAGVALYDNNWGDVIPKLNTPTHPCKGGHVCADPNGIWIYMLDGDAPVVPKTDIKGTILGKCMGVTIETTDMARSVALWQALGFAITMGTAESGWVVVSAEGCPGVSIMKPLMCPHLFFNPSLTYFNGKVGNPVVIENVRKAGIPITEEISHFNKDGIVDNIIIRDPGGYGFFLFND